MSKIKFEIKNKWTGSILFEYEKENNTLKDTVEQAIKEGACLRGADLRGAYLEGADLEGAYLEGAYLEGAYIYLDDNEINSAEIVKNFEEKNNIKITETYINKNIIPTRWNAFWKHGLIICDWEVKEEKEAKNKEIEEINFKEGTYAGEKINIMADKLNELIKDRNKLIKEREER